MQIRQQIALWGRDIPKNSCEVFLATYRVRYILLFVSIGKLTKEDRMEAFYPCWGTATACISKRWRNSSRAKGAWRHGFAAALS